MPKTVIGTGLNPEQDEAESAKALPRLDLRVCTLGRPSVKWAGCALDIPRRHVRAVLYRLVTPLTPLLGEYLCGLFLSDIPECTARRNLSHVLTHLHGLLPAPEVLLCTDDSIALDPQQTWSDTVAYDRLYLTLREPSPRLQALERAANLYRGSFLAGFSLPSSPEFELWADLERSAWERRYLETLAALVEAQTSRGKYYPAAIDYARRYLAINDLAEEMHRRLITLHAVVGDRHAALRQFEHCTLVLERELGVDPLPETRAVLAGRSRAVSSAAPPPAWTTRDPVLFSGNQDNLYAYVGSNAVNLYNQTGRKLGSPTLGDPFAARLNGRAC